MSANSRISPQAPASTHTTTARLLTMPPAVDGVSYARSACLPCRRSKRRCDRKVPICDLCTKKEIQCEYPPRHRGNHTQLAAKSPVGWAFDISSKNDDSSNDEPKQTSLSFSSFVESDANSIYFLAPHVFRHSRLELPRFNLPIPTDLSSLIGDASSVRNVAIKYFMTIHRWLPIVFKQGFFSSLLNPMAQRQTELGLLILCMKLCCTAPWAHSEQGCAKTELYRTAKKFHQVAESAGPLSVRVLQAGILIALYELGQSIYPAGYLTVGACARYGLALGIDKSILSTEKDAEVPHSWNELEENRRVWWAVVMFDRYLSLSNPSRPLSTENPTFDTYLPVDDMAWDEGTANSGDVVSISTGFTLKMGSFARLAQATYLLSQALRSLSSADVEGEVTVYDQTAQLRRTLLSLVHAADSETAVRRLEFCAQSEVSLSTILLLQEHSLLELYAHPDRERSQPSFETLCHEARTALGRLSAAAMSYNASCPHHPDTCDNVPIFLIHAMYQVACIYLTISGGTPDDEIREKLETIKQLLRLIDSRWKLAGMYVKILEAREITASLESIKTRGGIDFRVLYGPPPTTLQTSLTDGEPSPI